MEPVQCVKCPHNLAGRHCNECDLDMCKNCFVRIHRNPLIAAHTFSVVE
jgi:hypothetical protein